MLDFRSVFKCMALCLCCSSASGTAHPPQRATVLTANLTWNYSLNERLSLFYRWSLRMNFYWLAQWHQGSWWFREWDWISVSAVLVQIWQGRLAFTRLKVLVIIQMKSLSWICYVEKGRTKKAVRVTELPISSTETPCFLLCHERSHVLLLSSSLTPVESHKSHLHKESWPFWLPLPSKSTRYWWGNFAVFVYI